MLYKQNVKLCSLKQFLMYFSVEEIGTYMNSNVIRQRFMHPFFSYLSFYSILSAFWLVLLNVSPLPHLPEHTEIFSLSKLSKLDLCLCCTGAVFS